MMIIKYETKYLSDVIRLTRNYWANEVEMSPALETFIYDFLVRYYLYQDGYNYLLVENNEVLGFLLSSQKDDQNESLQYFQTKVKELNEKDKANAYAYLKYIEDNHQMVLKEMPKNSIYLGLILSHYHHGGMMLINKLKEEQKNKDIYLWTDETCNYRYYEKQGFKLIKEYVITLYGKPLKTFIYKA